MYIVDLYRRVRRAHFVEGMSVRRAARMFNLHRSTVSKIWARGLTIVQEVEPKRLMVSWKDQKAPKIV